MTFASSLSVTVSLIARSAPLTLALVNDLATVSLPTVTVPFMNSACGLQKYWYLPGLVNVC